MGAKHLKVRGAKVLHLPFIVSNGQIVLEYSGDVPLAEGTRGDLVVKASSIPDEALIARYTERHIVRLLPEGTELLVMLSNNRPFFLPQELESELKERADVTAQLGKWFQGGRRSATPSFVSITLGPLLPWQAVPDDSGTGGLWLELEGNRSVGLLSSGIILPKTVQVEGQVKSLNHAFTVLSETFEPQRISHTGNVYESVLYRETDDLWYPLKLFRDGHIADKEHEIAKAFWTDLKARLSGLAG